MNWEILKASKNNRNSPKAFHLMCPQLARICFGGSTDCFIYSFVIQVSSEKQKPCSFYQQFERYLCMKIIINIISTEIITNSLLSCFCLFYKPKTRARFSASWWSGNGKYISIFCLQRVRTTSEPCRTQYTFIKKFSYMLVLQFHAAAYLIWSQHVSQPLNIWWLKFAEKEIESFNSSCDTT